MAARYAKQTIQSGIAIVKYAEVDTPVVHNAPFTLVYRDGVVVAIGEGGRAPYENPVEEDAKSQNEQNERDIAEQLAPCDDDDCWPLIGFHGWFGVIEEMMARMIGDYRGRLDAVWIVDDEANAMATAYQAILCGDDLPRWKCASANAFETENDSEAWRRRYGDLTADSYRRLAEATKEGDERREKRRVQRRLEWMKELEEKQTGRSPGSPIVPAAIIVAVLALLVFLLCMIAA